MRCGIGDWGLRIKKYFYKLYYLFEFWRLMLKQNMEYYQLEVYLLAKELVKDIHLMSVKLPDHEKYETASQIRRSVKSIKSNIVEGYGRRSYKSDFIHFLIIAYASAEETLDHLDTLVECGSIKNDEAFLHLHQKADTLARKLNCFIKAVRKNHKT